MFAWHFLNFGFYILHSCVIITYPHEDEINVYGYFRPGLVNSVGTTEAIQAVKS